MATVFLKNPICSETNHSKNDSSCPKGRKISYAIFQC